MGGVRGEAYEGDLIDDSIGESVWAHIFTIANQFNVVELYLEKNLKSAFTACRRFISKRKLEDALAADSAGRQAATDAVHRIANIGR